jgi:hypothetical protein
MCLSRRIIGTNSLFLNTPKWIFISGPTQLAHAKEGKATPNQGGMVLLP